jgi:hypothetical protein
MVIGSAFFIFQTSCAQFVSQSAQQLHFDFLSLCMSYRYGQVCFGAAGAPHLHFRRVATPRIAPGRLECGFIVIPLD